MSVKIYDKTQNRWVIFPGTIGAPGKDAYLIAQENGYTGTKEEYNQVLVAIPNIINSIESTPTENSDNLITSGGVWQSIQDVRNDFPTAGTMTPQVAGEANVGVSNSYAREDHVHPAQTSISGNAETATKLANARTIELTGSVNGSASFDGSQDITINTEITNIDASKITSGTIDIERLPKGALERLVIVENQEARFALTSEDVQEGDTVKQEDTGVMYYVVNINNLSSEEGYKVYTAGAATSVPWSGITGKPDFLQLGETSDTAYAGDKGKLTTDITKSLGTQLLADSITVNKDSESITLSYNKKTRNSDSEVFVSNAGNAVIPSATQEQAGVMSAADKRNLDTMEWSSINLLDGSDVITVNASESSNFASYTQALGVLQSGDQFAISIEDIENLAGSPTEYEIRITPNPAISGVAYWGRVLLSQENKKGVITLSEATNNVPANIYIYAGVAGSTADNSIKYSKIMLVRGNKPSSSWFPSYNDIQSNTGSSIFTLTTEDISGETVTDEIYNGLLNAIDSNIPIYYNMTEDGSSGMLVANMAFYQSNTIFLTFDNSVLEGNQVIITRLNIVIDSSKKIITALGTLAGGNAIPNKSTVSGTAGTAYQWSREDHAHPEQTSIAGKDIATQEWVLQQLSNYVSKSGDSTISGTLTATAFKES